MRATTSVGPPAANLAPWPIPDAATLPLACRPSEIRFVRPRHVGIPSRVPLDVFGAKQFRPIKGDRCIRHGGLPRSREGALILDREFELKILAVTVRGSRANIMLLCVPFEPLFRRRGIQHSISLDHGQTLGVRRAIPIEHGLPY